MKNQNKKIAAKIIGVGSFVPNENKPISNQDLINKGVQTDDAWIIERTGIRQRYIANDLNYIFDKQKFLNNNADFQPTLTSDLAVAAAKNALQNANLNANDIDLMANSVLMLYENKEFADKLVSNAYKEVISKYDLKRVVIEHEKLFDAIVKKK